MQVFIKEISILNAMQLLIFYYNYFHSLFSDLRSLAGTTLLSLLASLFMSQLLFVIGVGGIQVKYRQNVCLIQRFLKSIVI